MRDQLIYCIPGDWESEKDFQSRLIEQTDGKYLPAGKVVFNPESQNGLEFDFRGYDERIPASLRLGLGNSFTKELEKEISNHKSVLYLIVKIETNDDISNSFHFVTALLNNGGIAVKIENSGKAHDKVKWKELTTRTDLHRFLDMFLICISSSKENIVYTCGMQLLDLPESCVVATSDPEYNWHIIYVLSSYLFIDKPEIIENQTFSEKVGAKGYRFEHMVSQYEEDSWFFNKNGMWKLVPIEEKKKPFWGIFG